jgi:hypothetical protein
MDARCWWQISASKDILTEKSALIFNSLSDCRLGLLIVIGSTEHHHCVFLVIQEGSEVSICAEGPEQYPFITNVTIPWPGRTFEDPDSLCSSEASTSNTLTAFSTQLRMCSMDIAGDTACCRALCNSWICRENQWPVTTVNNHQPGKMLNSDTRARPNTWCPTVLQRCERKWTSSTTNNTRGIKQETEQTLAATVFSTWSRNAN